jgi:hypothetical protein
MPTLLGDMSSFDLSNGLAISAPGVLSIGADADQRGVTPYTASADEAAAALVEITGASVTNVAQFEAGVPPNLAAAALLVDQLATSATVSEAAMGSLYTLMDPGSALALTRD